MGEPPTIEFLAGSPTEQEEEAARAAIFRLVYADQVASAPPASGMNPWILAARMEATGRAAGVTRARSGTNARRS